MATLRRAAALLLRRALALAFGIVQVLLLLRIALLALAANPDNTLVRLTLQASAGLEAPFSNIFRVNTIAAGAGVGHRCDGPCRRARLDAAAGAPARRPEPRLAFAALSPSDDAPRMTEVDR